jgi:iron complex outermembrane receptor protein
MPAKESAKQLPSCLPFPHVGSGFLKKQRAPNAACDNEQTMKSTLKQTALACAIMQAFSVQAQETPAPIQEVHITGTSWRGHSSASVGGFSESALVDTPASITSIGRADMQDLSIRSVSEAVKYDASVADSYNAVGYAEQFSIRGFALDNNASYRKDGFAISADAPVPLENKERIEVLKGLAGLQVGVASPGGIVNFATKRPTNTPLRSVTLEVRERGTVLGTIDLGGRFDDRRFGYRINAAAEDIHSYVRGANGERQFVSGAFDWRISPDATLELDFDHQHRAQITAPGYQLIRNQELPTGVSPKTLLNNQPWTKPVDTESSNLGLRFEYNFGPDWRATVAANRHWLKRDDYTAFPYGCSNEGDGFYPGYCSNGDYDVYDYQSVGERKNLLGVQAMLQGRFKTGTLGHALTLGAARSERRESFGAYVYDYAGSSNIYNNVIVPPAPGNPTTGPVMEMRSRPDNALFVQDIVTLSPQLKLHAGLRHVQAKRTELVENDEGLFDTVRASNSYLLPSVALVYSPVAGWNVYGSVSHGLEHGGVAPIETTNANTALDASRSKQFELGVKGAVNSTLSVAAALFQIRRGLEYTDEATNTYVRNGERTHRGLELSATGKAGKELDYGLSLMALHTQQQGTGDPSIDGKRVANVPHFQSTAWVEYAVPAVPALTVSGVWQHAGKKAFDEENRTMVPGYDVFGLGAAYAMNVGATRVTLRARAENVFNKFYWRDVSPELGGYLLPGAPRTFRLSAQFDF